MSSRFDIAALRKLAGDKVFSRGKTYHRQEKVRIASIDAVRVLARVVGNETYSVELTGHGRALGGSCSCPAFEDWPVQIHLEAAYAEAAILIARMARLRSKREQDAYMEQLRSRHGRKRNFMKLLG